MVSAQDGWKWRTVSVDCGEGGGPAQERGDEMVDGASADLGRVVAEGAMHAGYPALSRTLAIVEAHSALSLPPPESTTACL